MSLADEELDRYARHLVLREIGGAGQAAIKASHVVVIGAGGIGCPALLYLAAAGVGRLTIVDDDRVDLGNLQRQILFATADVGRAKVDVAAERLRAVNPHVAVTPHAMRIDAANARAVISDASIILDGSDNFATRLVVSDASVAARVPLVSAALGQFQGQVGTFRGWDGGACYRCFVGDAFNAEDCDTCAEQGVLGAMAGMVGSFGAVEVLRAITGFGSDPAGLVHILDGLTMRMRPIRIARDPACRGCTE